MLRISRVEPRGELQLFVEFEDGRRGTFDVRPYVGSAFFAQLGRPDYFAQVRLFFRGVGWPDGQDFGPDTIAAELSQVS